MYTTLLNEVGVKGITVWWGLNYFAVHQNAFKRNNLVYFPNDRNLVHFFLRLAPDALNCICVEWFVCTSAFQPTGWLLRGLIRIPKYMRAQTSFQRRVLVSILERFSNDCRKSKTKAIRAVFKWLSKVITWLRLPRLVIGLKDSRQFF